MARKALIHKNTNLTTNNGGVLSPKLPTAGTLRKGEIAVNYKDGYETLSIENDAGEVIPFASLELIIAYTDTTISNKKYAGSTSDGGTANKAASIPFGSVDFTSTATAFTANVDGITELRDGVSLYLKNTVITSAAATTAPKCWTLNINNLGAKPVYVTTAAATYSTNHFTKNYKMLFTYDTSLNSGNGGWYIGQLFDSNTTYSDMTQAEITAGTGTTGRKITPKMLRNNFYTEDEVDDLLGSKANSNDLATVATSGDYNDLTNRPVSIVSSVNGMTGAVTVDVGVTSFNGSTGAVTYTAPVTSVNGQTGAVTVKANVQSDWNATSGDAVILNKPTIKDELSSEYQPSTLTNEDLQLAGGDSYEEAFSKLEKTINDNEEVTAAALTDLDERIPVIDQELSETSENPVQNKVITQAIIDNEYVVSTALNNINDRLENKQDTLVSGTNIKTINGTSILGSGNISIAGGSGTGGGDTNVIEIVKVNGTALTPDANKAVDITVPTTLDSISDGTTRKLSNYLPLSGGTMTGAITVAPGDGKGLLFSTTSNINVSGTTNTILGFYNNTYIIGHTAYPVNIRGNATRPQYNGKQLALYSDIPSAVTESTVSGWGFTKNAGTVTGVKMNGTTNNPTSGVVDLGTVITEHQDISGKANKNGSFNEEFNVSALNIDADGEQINLRADYNSQEKEVTLDITESNGGCHLKYIFDESADTKYIATTDDLPTKTSDLTNDSGFLTTHQSIKSLNTNNTSAQTASASETIAGSGTINLHKVAKTGTYNDLIGKPTIPAAQVQSDWNATSGMGVILNKPTIPTVNNATLTIQKNGTTVNTFTANASSNVTANIQVNELPTVSSSDNGKILQVVNGAWSLVTPVTVYTGTSTPNSSLGINGDLYVLTS